jgi:cob(I)alamin adenosyltransferase
MNKGSVIVYFGNGKGKSSSAIGHAICAAGMGASVAIIQFLKGNNQKEIEFLKRLEPEVRLFSFEKNAEFFEELSEEQRQEEIQNIKNGLGFAKKVLDGRKYHSCSG